MNSFINRKEMYFFERIYRYISIPVVKGLAKTKVTPNMVTITNLILAGLNSYLMLSNKVYYLSAFLMFVYYFLDVIDVNLARFTGKTSKLGAKLDEVADGISYNLFIISLGVNNVPLIWICMLLFIMNFYSFITTKYIVPNIRLIRNFKRVGIKKYLMSKGIILGIDFSLLGVLIAAAIISGEYVFMYKFILALYIMDLLYRLIELWINKYLDRK